MRGKIKNAGRQLCKCFGQLERETDMRKYCACPTLNVDREAMSTSSSSVADEAATLALTGASSLKVDRNEGNQDSVAT